MIEYRLLTENSISVKLDGVVTGTIKRTQDGGWQYFPKGQRTGGAVFPSLQLLKESLATPEQGPEMLKVLVAIYTFWRECRGRSPLSPGAMILDGDETIFEAVERVILLAKKG